MSSTCATRAWRLETADVVSALDGDAGIGADLADAIAIHRLIDEVYDR